MSERGHRGFLLVYRSVLHPRGTPFAVVLVFSGNSERFGLFRRGVASLCDHTSCHLGRYRELHCWFQTLKPARRLHGGGSLSVGWACLLPVSAGSDSLGGLCNQCYARLLHCRLRFPACSIEQHMKCPSHVAEVSLPATCHPFTFQAMCLADSKSWHLQVPSASQSPALQPPKDGTTHECYADAARSMPAGHSKLDCC
jgi:hypothetical protein